MILSHEVNYIMDAPAPAHCVTILLPPGLALTPGSLGLILRYAQRRGGAEPWGGAVAEVFRAAHGTLLIVRPALAVRLAPYALPIIHKYFKE